MKFNKQLLFNTIFLGGLLVLFLNDHFWKQSFGNAFTGKLSDVAGLLVFPMFLAAVFPRLGRWTVLYTAVFFVFWKSACADGFIAFYNSISFIPITRTVDSTDLWALLILPLSYLFSTNKKWIAPFKITSFRMHPLLIVLPASLVFMATSPPPSFYYTYSDGNVRCGRCKIKMKLTTEEALERFATAEIDIYKHSFIEENDSIRPNWRILKGQNDGYFFYRIDKLLLAGDTLKTVNLSLIENKEKTTLYFNGFQRKGQDTISYIKRKQWHIYKKALKELLDNKN